MERRRSRCFLRPGLDLGPALVRRSEPGARRAAAERGRRNMTGWVYSRQKHASYAKERLLWQHHNDWPAFGCSVNDIWVLRWLRSLRDSDLVDYCALMPCLALGVPLAPELRDRAEALKSQRHQARRQAISGPGADASVVQAFRRSMDGRFGHPGRRSDDGMRAHHWRIDDTEFRVEYRLRFKSALELEVSHPTVERLFPSMLLGTPTHFSVDELEDVEPAARYVDVWLEEIAAFVRATR